MRQFLIPARIQNLPGLLLAGLLLVLFAGAGCKKSVAEEASDSDANGYLCPACGLKFYTKRTEFPFLCPKCGKNGIEEVVAYRCPKDQHLTLVAKSKRGGITCEQCGAAVSGMILPRERDLTAWGAAKY